MKSALRDTQTDILVEVQVCVCVHIYIYIHTYMPLPVPVPMHIHIQNNEREQEMDDADHASLWAVCMLRAIVQAKEQSWEGICGSTASSR